MATQAQLQQVMCHINAATYQAYINQRVQCDTSAAFLGRPSNKALLKAAGHMSRYCDPDAPTDVSPSKLKEIKSDPKLMSLTKLRDNLSQEVRHESGTIKQAEKDSTKLYHMYRETQNLVRSTQEHLRKLAKASTRNEFFQRVNTNEINLQLNIANNKAFGSPAKPQQSQSSHSLQERRLLAELICADTNDSDDYTRLKHRMYTTQAMINLGRKKDFSLPNSTATHSSCKSPANEIKLLADDIPETCDRKQCFMCFWNDKAPENKRKHKFFSSQRAREHVLGQHLHSIGNQPVFCPNPSCKDTKTSFWELNGFLNHLVRVHGYDIFTRYKGFQYN